MSDSVSDGIIQVNGAEFRYDAIGAGYPLILSLISPDSAELAFQFFSTWAN